MTDHTPDALASALPAGIAYDPHVRPGRDVWTARRIAQFQAERLAEAGYVLVHTAPDEATVERLARAVHAAHHHNGLSDSPTDGDRQDVRETLAALADTSAQARARRTADDTAGGGAS